ncbi:MAG: hypothetical protein AAFR87_29745 [Bacteroidota bacterium]
MSTLASIMGGIVSALFFFVAYRKWKLKRNTQKRDLEIFEKAKPLIEAVENGQDPDPALVRELAEDAASRTFLYVVLDGHDKLELFPEKYDNFISSAEAALVYWLLHPNELGSRPEKIKFMKKVEIVHEIKEKEEKLNFYVFKFKEIANEGEWEAGVAGPYVESSNPYDFAPGTFSLFETFDSKSPKEHAEAVHELCLKKKMY